MFPVFVMQGIFPAFVIGYTDLLVLGLCMLFFGKGAQFEGKSPLVWAALSLGSWIGLGALWGGRLGGLTSQVLLFLAIAATGVLREHRAAAKRG